MMGVSRIVLTGPAGDTVWLGPPAADSMGSHTILARLGAPLAAGAYSVHWVAAGRDGHPERGSFSFTVLGSSPGAAVAASRDTAMNETATDTAAPDYALTIARWTGFLALFSVLGAVAFKLFILPRVERFTEAGDPFVHIASVGAATYGLFASIALILATIIKLYAESRAMRDIPPEAILLTTGWGWAWSMQMLACLIAVVAFVIAHRGTGQGWSLAALAAALLAVTPAATGHAIGSDEAVFAVPLDIVHVLAGSAWLGTLAVILIVGIGAAAKTPGTVSLGARVAAMISAFSPLALVCGAAIVATGVVASLLHLEPFSSLWTSTYGKVLIVKLALVSLLLVVGAWNWRRVKPTLGGDEGVKALRLSARVELAVSALVLAVTAVLVALPLPE
jgi:copper transport protein